jgi:alkylhydroperoxidase/carboxymuconolactone decarboxylase family protein YurZ
MSAEEKTGEEIKTILFGQTGRARAVMDRLAPGLGDVIDRALWDGIWSRSGLDLRTRSLCTISALLALERFEYARAHIYGARNLGIPQSEVTEAVVQLTMYAGLPVLHEGLNLIVQVYDDPEPFSGSAIPESVHPRTG